MPIDLPAANVSRIIFILRNSFIAAGKNHQRRTSTFEASAKDLVSFLSRCERKVGEASRFALFRTEQTEAVRLRRSSSYGEMPAFISAESSELLASRTTCSNGCRQYSSRKISMERKPS